MERRGVWAAAIAGAPPGVVRRLARVVEERQKANFAEYVMSQFAEGRSTGRSEARDVLCGSQVLVRGMLDPEGFTAEESLVLLRVMMRLDARFDGRLLQNLLAMRLWPEEVPVGEIMRALTLLESCPDCGRLAVVLSKFARHPNERVQSKAAKLLGRTADNLDWLWEMYRNVDSRVRANLIEGIGMRNDAEPFLELVAVASKDTSNRVSTLALALLAQRGHRVSRALLEMRRRSPVDGIRKTAEFAYDRLLAGREGGAAPGGGPEPLKSTDLAGGGAVVETAVTAAIEEVHEEAQGHPDKEPEPVLHT